MGTSGTAFDNTQAATTQAEQTAAANREEINALSKETLGEKVAQMYQREAAAEKGGAQLSELDQIWHKELKAKIARDAAEANEKARAADNERRAQQNAYTPETDRAEPIDPSKRVKITDGIANGLRGDLPKEVPIAIFTLKEVDGKTVDKAFMNDHLQEMKDQLAREGKSQADLDKLRIVSTVAADGQEVFGIAGIEAKEANRVSSKAREEKERAAAAGQGTVNFDSSELSTVKNVKHKDLSPQEKGLVDVALLLEQSQQAKANGHPGHARNLARAAMVTLQANELTGPAAKKLSPEQMERAASFLTQDQIKKLNNVTDLDVPNHGKSTPPSQLPENYKDDINGLNRGKVATMKQHVKAAKLDMKADMIEMANIPGDTAKLAWAGIKDAVNAAKNKFSDMLENKRDKKDLAALESGKISPEAYAQLQAIKGSMEVAAKKPSNIDNAIKNIEARAAENHGKANQARGR